jgi:hypothetical protein
MNNREIYTVGFHFLFFPPPIRCTVVLLLFFLYFQWRRCGRNFFFIDRVLVVKNKKNIKGERDGGREKNII